MLKKNDIVVYIRNHNIYNDLTYGKNYRIIKILSLQGLISIINDNNKLRFYYIKNFITINEFNILHRIDKINNILK